MEVGKMVRQDFIEMFQGTMIRGKDSGAEGPRFLSPPLPSSNCVFLGKAFDLLVP